MRAWFRDRSISLSPSTVLAFIALVVALGGTAYAATATIVNIADPTTQANKAKVSAGGRLYAYSTDQPPTTPFNFNGYSYGDGNASIQNSTSSATVALTGFSMSPSSSATGATSLSLYEYGQTSAPSCVATGISRFIGTWTISGPQTYNEQLSTPIIIKPLPGASSWCLITYATPGGIYTNYNGYVVSGTFTGNGTASKMSAKQLRRGVAPRR